jgi:sulfite reductase alpha subunit-like flavoprotein
LAGYVRDGTLTELHLAVSRDADAPHKYVQHCLAAHGAAVCR